MATAFNADPALVYDADDRDLVPTGDPVQDLDRLVHLIKAYAGDGVSATAQTWREAGNPELAAILEFAGHVLEAWEQGLEAGDGRS